MESDTLLACFSLPFQNISEQIKLLLLSFSLLWIFVFRYRYCQTLAGMYFIHWCVQGSGPLSSAVLGVSGYRLTCVLGSLLATAAFLLTGLMMHLGVTFILPYYSVTGAMAGLGLGLLYMVARAVINEWFDRRMGLATGIACAGSGVGQLVMAPLMVMTMDTLGLPLTFLMLGSVTGTATILGLTLDVPENSNKSNEVVSFLDNACILCCVDLSIPISSDYDQERKT